LVISKVSILVDDIVVVVDDAASKEITETALPAPISIPDFAVMTPTDIPIFDVLPNPSVSFRVPAKENDTVAKPALKTAVTPDPTKLIVPAVPMVVPSSLITIPVPAICAAVIF